MSKKNWHEGIGSKKRALVDKISDEKLNWTARKLLFSADNSFSDIVNLKNQQEAIEIDGLYYKALEQLALADKLCEERAHYKDIYRAAHRAIHFISMVSQRLGGLKVTSTVNSALVYLDDIETPIQDFLYACSKFLKDQTD